MSYTDELKGKMMQSFTWSNLTLKACRCLSGQFSLYNAGIYGECLMVEQLLTNQKVKSWRENATDLRKKAWNIIENWDIRCAGRLFEIFPSIIPKQYRGKPCTAEYNKRGNWVINFGE